MSKSSWSGPRVAGASLIAAAVLFIAVFSVLATTFNYPDVLDARAEDVLPALLALGDDGRAVWALYACIPLLLIPAAAGAGALHDTGMRRALVTVGEWCAVLSGIAMMLGLVRWPSLQWELARAWVDADGGQRVVMSAVFDGANMMFGRFIGEFVGELLLNVAFVAFSVAAWQDGRLPRWVAGAGVAAGVIGLVAMWRNVTALVSGVAEVNNAVLPLWLLIWGWALWRAGSRTVRA